MMRPVAFTLVLVLAGSIWALHLGVAAAVGGEADAALAEIAVKQPAHALAGSDTLWGGLIIATNEAAPAELPNELRGQQNRLVAFGYNQFRLIGQNQKMVPTGTEDWLVPGRYFSLKVDTKYPLLAGGYALGLQLFQQHKMLVEADVNLQHGRPLFIRGPMVGNGQLIIILMVR